MSDEAGVVLSVRGEATLMVPADSVLLSAAITVSRGSKPDALADASAALQRLTTDLAAVGGVTQRVGTERDSLTWLARSATTRDETRPNKVTGYHEPTGEIIATVSVQMTVRDFTILDALGAQLSTHEDLNVHRISWQVDADNPGWAQVRAAAIHAAIDKGRDYAVALGVSLVEVLHVADAGLLDGDPVRVGGGYALAAGLSRGGGAPSDTPSLDPEPQELSAVIDARLRATTVALTEN